MGTPDGYEECTDKVLEKLKKEDDKSKEDKEHDELVAKAAEFYKKLGCTVYVAKSSTKGKEKKPRTCDLIITCPSEQCKPGFVVLVEVKGESGLDSAVKQLEEGAKAAQKAGIIPDKPDKKTLEKCFHSIVLVQDGKTLKNAGKLKNEENKTPIGDQKIVPDTTNDVNKLPKP